MSREKIYISKNVLRDLYFNKRLSFTVIANILRCSSPTVVSRFRDYGLKAKKCGEWKIKYKKKNFSGNKVEKAYILGFSVGDINAYKSSKNGNVIVARCHTTQKEQVRLFCSVFQKYGHVTVSHSQTTNNLPSFHINCYLNDSFSFLLISKPYHVENWIKNNFKNSISFIAGYIDAEGNFIINQRRARFKIDSYDFFILSWMHKWCCYHGIKSKLRLISKKGSARYDKSSFWNNDLWRLNINEAHGLLKFCKIIFPFLKHKKRVKDIRLCILNINKRKKDGTI